MDTENTGPPTDRVDKAARSRVHACWSCGGPVAATAMFCGTCQAVQPPSQADHFARLGLDIAFDLEPALLERRYFDLQRRLHPDRFATKTPREKAFSMRQATSLNESYECLRDPLRRAEYLIGLRGAEITDGCNMVNDQEMLIEQMELREALAEAETGDDVAAVEARARNDIQLCLGKLSALFADLRIESACRQVTRLKYLRKLAEEARQRRVQMGRR